MSDESEIDNRRLLEKIRNVIPKLNEMGKRKGAAEKRCMITLYAASSLTNLKHKGHINKKDGCRYFSISTLRDIAKNEEKIFGTDVDVLFDIDTATKAYKKLEQQNGYVKFLPKQDISKDICLGDTSPVTITEEGKKDCKNIIDELLDDLKLIENSSTTLRVEDDLVQFDQRYGLSWLRRDYFRYHKSTDSDLNSWKDGFPYELPSIKMKRELRRENILEDIKRKLDSEGKLLIIGQSGSSKSTILMELMCDYFDAGYEVLYNYGVTDIRNVDGLVNFIEDMLRKDKKILVAIDNAHKENTHSIFYFIDKVSNSQLTKKLKIIMTARLPEFDLLLNGLEKVEEEIRKSIRKLNADPNFIYQLPYFTRGEIKEFINRYSGIIDEKLSDKITEEIYNYTKGDPVMVKFSVFRQGLDRDVQELCARYLGSQRSMKTMLICSLLDISNTEITDKVLEKCGVLEGADHLNGSILHRNPDGLWKTKHPRWDLELFYFLYNEKSRTLVEQRKQDLRDSLIALYRMKEEEITYSAIGTLFSIAAQNFVPLDIADAVFQQSISQIAIPDEEKSSLYTSHIARAYYELKKYQEAIDNLNQALQLNPRNVVAYDIKGTILMELEKYDEAVECFHKELEIDPNMASVWVHKGESLVYLQNNKEATKCFDKALDLWMNAGVGLYNLAKYREAIECCDRSLEIVQYMKSLHENRNEDHIQEMNRKEANTLSLKGNSLLKYGKWDDAIDTYRESLNLNAADPNTWLNEGICHHRLGGYKHAIFCYDKVLEIDPDHASARDLKDRALVAAKRWKRSMSIVQSTESGTLQVLSDTSYIDHVGSFHVVGEVASAKLATVIGTFYDASGTVVGTSFAYTDPHDLIPGDRAPFHLMFTPASAPANQIEHYTLQLKFE